MSYNKRRFTAFLFFLKLFFRNQAKKPLPFQGAAWGWCGVSLSAFGNERISLSPAPQTLCGNLLDKLAAAEGDNRILVSRSPSFGVAIDEGNEARNRKVIHATIKESLIFVLAIDDADGAVFLHEGDREEPAFGLCDQVVEFGLHGLDVVFLRNGEIVDFFVEGCKLFLVVFFVDFFKHHSGDDGANGHEDKGDEDSSGEVLSNVHLFRVVRLVSCRGENERKTEVLQDLFGIFSRKKDCAFFAFCLAKNLFLVKVPLT